MRGEWVGDGKERGGGGWDGKAWVNRAGLGRSGAGSVSQTGLD